MFAFEYLRQDEIAAVLKRLHRWAGKYPNTHRNLIVFRLSGCLGMRATEISRLNLKDVSLCPPRPAVRVRKPIKRGKPRVIPIWDTGTLEDLGNWITLRKQMGAGPDDPVVCAMSPKHYGKRRNRQTLASYWKSAIKSLGKERVAQLSIHSGRHTFCTQLVLAGIPITDVRDAAGHRDVQTTNIYLHALQETGTRHIFG
jgi:integrase/recombinase XerD